MHPNQAIDELATLFFPIELVQQLKNVLLSWKWKSRRWNFDTHRLCNLITNH